MLARVIVIATCLSVCPSVTRRYCVKTKKASGMISLPSGSPKTVVFWRQISSPNSKGFPPNGASNMGLSEKFSDFFSFKRLYLKQESHAVAGKPRDAAVNSDRYQQPVGQKQSEWETENIT